METDLYERHGKAITNFSNTLPEEQSDLAQAITKDPYNFDFLTLREKYDEKELKDAIVEKVNNFLMELGTGFAYMGKQEYVSLQVDDVTHASALLESMGIQNFSILDKEIIHIYDSDVSGKVLSKAFIENGIGLESIGRKRIRWKIESVI